MASTASKGRKKTPAKTGRGGAKGGKQKTTRKPSAAELQAQSAITSEIILIGVLALTILLFLCNFGVIGVIYEARPNVTFDVFSLCFKSGNACVLKGGSDADSSNRALVAIIHDVLTRQGVDPAVCTLLPPDREATTELLNAVGLVDLIIPRGSSSLINYVRDHARVPVIETGAGICHT